LRFVNFSINEYYYSKYTRKAFAADGANAVLSRCRKLTALLRIPELDLRGNFAVRVKEEKRDEWRRKGKERKSRKGWEEDTPK